MASGDEGEIDFILNHMEHINESAPLAQLETLIRDRGADSKEAKQAIALWVQSEEVKGLACSNQQESIRHNIGFLMQKAALCQCAGDFEEARSLLESARFQAHQEDEVELQSEVEARLDELER